MSVDPAGLVPGKEYLVTVRARYRTNAGSRRRWWLIGGGDILAGEFNQSAAVVKVEPVPPSLPEGCTRVEDRNGDVWHKRDNGEWGDLRGLWFGRQLLDLHTLCGPLVPLMAGEPIT